MSYNDRIPLELFRWNSSGAIPGEFLRSSPNTESSKNVFNDNSSGSPHGDVKMYFSTGFLKEWTSRGCSEELPFNSSSGTLYMRSLCWGNMRIECTPPLEFQRNSSFRMYLKRRVLKTPLEFLKWFTLHEEDMRMTLLKTSIFQWSEKYSSSVDVKWIF